MEKMDDQLKIFYQKDIWQQIKQIGSHHYIDRELEFIPLSTKETIKSFEISQYITDVFFNGCKKKTMNKKYSTKKTFGCMLSKEVVVIALMLPELEFIPLSTQETIKSFEISQYISDVL